MRPALYPKQPPQTLLAFHRHARHRVLPLHCERFVRQSDLERFNQSITRLDCHLDSPQVIRLTVLRSPLTRLLVHDQRLFFFLRQHEQRVVTLRHAQFANGQLRLGV